MRKSSLRGVLSIAKQNIKFNNQKFEVYDDHQKDEAIVVHLTRQKSQMNLPGCSANYQQGQDYY
jgi:hypothetical protein